MPYMHTKNIIICDDHPDVAKSIFLNLSHLPDVRVISFTSGGRLVSYLNQLLQDHRALPDLLILDLWLPDIEGDDIIAWMRTVPELSKVPAILMSAVIVNVQHRARYVGADDFLIKPFGVEEFLKKVERLLFKDAENGNGVEVR